MVGQGGNLFVLAENLGFTLAFREGRDGGRKRCTVTQGDWEAEQINSTSPNLLVACVGCTAGQCSTWLGSVLKAECKAAVLQQLETAGAPAGDREVAEFPNWSGSCWQSGVDVLARAGRLLAAAQVSAALLSSAASVS